MRVTRWFVAATLAVGMIAVVEAQQGRPGGGFGRGGFGGPIELLKQKAVAEDLKISDEQLEKMKTWAKEFQPKLDEKTKAKFAELKDVPEDQRRAKFAAVRSELNQETYRELEGVLKPEQVKRLKQIDTQNSGIRAFSNTEVAASLKITDEQKEKLKGIADDLSKETREVFGGGGNTKGNFNREKFAENQKTIQKLNKEALGKAIDLLTADQKTAWKDLTGEPFDTSKIQQGFGFGGGRPQPKKD
jgi:Spy/CpxP family protein refolding chaperone